MQSTGSESGTKSRGNPKLNWSSKFIDSPPVPNRAAEIQPRIAIVSPCQDKTKNRRFLCKPFASVQYFRKTSLSFTDFIVITANLFWCLIFPYESLTQKRRLTFYRQTPSIVIIVCIVAEIVMICQLCLYSKVHHIFKNTADVVVSENKCHNFINNTLKNVKFNASTKVIISSIIFLYKRKRGMQDDSRKESD